LGIVALIACMTTGIFEKKPLGFPRKSSVFEKSERLTIFFSKIFKIEISIKKMKNHSKNQKNHLVFDKTALFFIFKPNFRF
jgi:hypothetical protein